jgi:hypothetical protein
MSRPRTRKAAVDAASKDDALTVEPDAEDAGVREWLSSLPAAPPPGVRAAAFDTRMDAPAVLTGRASKAIDRALRHHGLETIVDPESFLVTKQNELEPDEETRAAAWGASLAARIDAGISR